MTAQANQPSPIMFFETVTAYQRSEALKAAIELDLFTTIGDGSRTASEIAARCGSAERGIRILCDYMAMLGFLTKQGAVYDLTQDSAVFLNRHSPAYIGSVTQFILDDYVVREFRSLTEAVRKGGTAIPEEGSLAPGHPMWEKFARAMAPMMRPLSQMIAKIVDPDAGGKLKILDIASSHGVFGLAFATRNPNVEVFAVDWANVVTIGVENARAAGVADRYHPIPGSAFAVDYGSGYDVVLITNFLHHLDSATIELLLRKVHAALADGGRVATLEFVPNEDRISPPGTAGFSLTMLAGTPGGDAYTFSELDRMFRNAGFAKSEIHSLEPSFQQLIVSTK